MTEASQREVGVETAVADALARSLARAGTEVVFGVPGGGANLDLVGALTRVGIRFVLTHMETPAAIMAATYADLTGKPGACVATRGPGAASLANGVTQAYLDRSAIIAVTDAIAPATAMRVSRQRIDHQALFAPITKWSTAISVERAEETAVRAVEIACEGRPGPVHLDTVSGSADVAPYREPSGAPLPDYEAAIALLSKSSNPVIIAGLGSVRVKHTLRALASRSGCRVMTTYRAKGVFSENSPSHGGLFTGGTIESSALADADLLVLVGVDPVELIGGPWSYPTNILSLMPWERDASYYAPTVELVGELENLLSRIGEHVPVVGASDGQRFRERARLSVHIDVEGIAPHALTLIARELAPSNTCATVDSGAHMLVAMPDWTVDDVGEALISSGNATMGYALPAAIAAAVVHPDRRVVCFTGDGGLGMTVSELETASRLRLPITVVVFNDSALSLIEIKRQPVLHGPIDAVRYSATDFAAIATGFGVKGRRVSSESEFKSAFAASMEEDGPTLLDVEIDPSGYEGVLAATRG